MKRFHKYIGFGLLGVALSLPFVGNTPVSANLKQMGAAIAQIINRPKVDLNLSVAKKVVSVDQAGKEVVSYEDLGTQAEVSPGSTLRYRLVAQNSGDVEASDLILNQVVPDGMVYVLDSAQSNIKAEATYKLKESYERPADSKEFEAAPQIVVEVRLADGTLVKEAQAAPAEAYEQIRWSFDDRLAPKGDIEVSYDVQVK